MGDWHAVVLQQTDLQHRQSVSRLRGRVDDSKAQITAIATGDARLEKGADLLRFGPRHPASATSLALVGGWKVLFTGKTELVQKFQATRRELDLDAAIDRLGRFPCGSSTTFLTSPGPGRDLRAVRTDQQLLRRQVHAFHRQPAVRRKDKGLSRSRHDSRRDRSPRPSRHHLRDECRELPARGRRAKARTRSAAWMGRMFPVEVSATTTKAGRPLP
jgi:hypothetical protein